MEASQSATETQSVAPHIPSPEASGVPKAEDVAAEERARTVPPEAKPPETPAEQPAEKPKEDRIARMRAAQEKKGLAAKEPEVVQAAGRTPTGQEVPADLDVSGRYSVIIGSGPDGKASLQFYTSQKKAKEARAAAKKEGKQVYMGETKPDAVGTYPTFASYKDSLASVFKDLGVKPEDVTAEFIGNDDPLGEYAERGERGKRMEEITAEKQAARMAKGKAVPPDPALRPADPVKRRNGRKSSPKPGPRERLRMRRSGPPIRRKKRPDVKLKER